MKLYMHPASTTCRPIMLFAADHGIALEQQVVDLFTGEQFKPNYVAVNPSCQVPVLEDEGFRLTESSAILKYLADKIGSPAYPKDPKARARVNEVMDWVNTGFYRTFGYGLCYAQLLEDYKLADPAAQSLAVAAGKRHAERFLRVLEGNLLAGGRAWLCGDAVTIADYLASGMISLGEVIGCTYGGYPNIARWYGRMKDRPNWRTVNAALYGWAEAARGPAYVTL